MRESEPLETDIMFRAGRDPAETIAELTRLGMGSGQLEIPGNLDLSCAAQRSEALRDSRPEYRQHLYGVG